MVFVEESYVFYFWREIQIFKEIFYGHEFEKLRMTRAKPVPRNR
jgi:hypothetical protein